MTPATLAKPMTVPTAVLAVLSTATIEKDLVTLNCGQLDRKTYQAVNDVLTQIGGKWNRARGGHVFTGDSAELLDDVILTGTVDRRMDVAKAAGFFESPPEVIATLEELAQIDCTGLQALEPSAGRGAIADMLARRGCRIVCAELLPENRSVLEAKGYHIGASDFLTLNPAPVFDRVVMNPPFARGTDVAHVHHALQFLAPGGRLVSVMSAGVTFRQDRLTSAFREMVYERGGEITPLPDASFKASGTMVNTVVVVVDA